MTILCVDETHTTLQRLHTSAPERYALGAEWPLMPSVWQETVFDRCKVLICRNPTEIRCGFRDGEEILAHGYCAAIALPIVRHSGAQSSCIGVVNLLFTHDLHVPVESNEQQLGKSLAQIDQFLLSTLSPW